MQCTHNVTYKMCALNIVCIVLLLLLLLLHNVTYKMTSCFADNVCCLLNNILSIVCQVMAGDRVVITCADGYKAFYTRGSRKNPKCLDSRAYQVIDRVEIAGIAGMVE